MFKYKVKANRDVIVEGLAVLTADETYEFTEEQAHGFWNMRGLQLNQCNVPSGVSVTIVVVPDVPLDEADAKYINDGEA